MVDIIKADGEAAFQLLKESGFKGVPDGAASGGLVMVGNGANITVNVNNGVIGDNNTNVNSGSNIINSGVNSGDTINRLLSIIEAQSRQITQLTTQLTELLSQGIITSIKN
jgi:ABC-type transport system substrate-binding protein